MENSYPAALKHKPSLGNVRKNRAQKEDLRSKCPKQVHKLRLPAKSAAKFYAGFALVLFLNYLNQITASPYVDTS